MSRVCVMMIALTMLFSVGCASSGRYYWGDYEQTLHASYTNPEEYDAFVKHLSTIMVKAEERGNTVPPGVAAEYGFALYRAGQFDQAVVFLRREADSWPQSAILMNRLIDAIEQDDSESSDREASEDPASNGAPSEAGGAQSKANVDDVQAGSSK